MTDNTPSIEVHNNQTEQRYEAEVDRQLAIAQYRMEGADTIVFTHTAVPPELEGHGVASHLIQAALDGARRQQLSVVPQCPFVAAYIRHHQEYLDIVKPEYQARLQSK